MHIVSVSASLAVVVNTALCRSADSRLAERRVFPTALEWTGRDLCLPGYRRIITRPTEAVHAPPPRCPVRGDPAPYARSGGDPGGPGAARAASLSLVGTSARPDRQTVRVIYVPSILSVLSARHVPRRLLALIKKSAHEIVDWHISIHLNRTDSILFSPLIIHCFRFPIPPSTPTLR